MSDVLIVGASVAGVRTAQALRAEGFAGRITLLDAEPHEPYDKPPLSKGLLTGPPRADIGLFTVGEAQASDIELRLGERATTADLERCTVGTAAGDTIEYTHLVVATGARARRPPWADLPGVHTLRTLDDATAIRRQLTPGARVVIVGAGFIGAELASAAVAAGTQVTLVDPQPSPMSRLLSPSVGTIFTEWHRGHVLTEFGVGVAGVAHSEGALAVALTDGRHLKADLVLVGIGVELNLEWLEGSRACLDGGVRCDSAGRMLDVGGTIIRDHFAVGDVSRWFDPRRGEHVRIEHWTNAVEQALVVGRVIVDPDTVTAHVPSAAVWSDQFDWKVQMAGDTRSDDVVIVREEGRFAALYAHDGALVGILTVNWPRMQVQGRRAIAAGLTRDALTSNHPVAT